VKRFPAFDPPEYVNWQPDPALVRAFRETLERDPERRALVAALTKEDHRALYVGLLRTRLSRLLGLLLGLLLLVHDLADLRRGCAQRLRRGLDAVDVVGLEGVA